jgi:hypothetical protein
VKATRENVIQAFDALDSNVVDFETRQRKSHLAKYKTDRWILTDDELMFESLCDLFGFDAEDRAYLHLLNGRANGVSPDDDLIVGEVDLGRQLPGDNDSLDGSMKKRAYRAFQAVDAKQRARGRMLVDRTPGKLVTAEGKERETGRRFAGRGKKKRLGATYRYWLPQAIVEGREMAKGLVSVQLLNGKFSKKRRDRFRAAALAVFKSDLLPACHPLPAPKIKTPTVRAADDVKIDVSASEVYERATGERPPATPTGTPATVSPSRVPRSIRRFKDNALLALRNASEQGGEAFNRQAAILFVELARSVSEFKGGDAGDTSAAIRQTVDLLQTILSSDDALSSLEHSIDLLNADLNKEDSATESADAENHNFERQSAKSPAKTGVGVQRLDTTVHKSRLIPKEKVEEVRARADVVRVVGARVKLRRAGSNYVGLCPFHEEKSGSFNVTPSRGTYHCFGCEAHGDVFAFVMQTEIVNFPEAVRRVAELSGVPPAESPPRGEDLIL